MKTKSVSIESLTSDPANVRAHGTRSLESIRASLQRFGQQKPIVVDAKGVVIAGNGTLEAARMLGWSKIAVVHTELEGADAVAYAIADNRIAELSDWDKDALGQVLAEFQNTEGFDELVTGFSESEIEKLTGRGIDPDEDADTSERGSPDGAEFRVVVIVETEMDQQALVEQLEGEGYKARAETVS